MLESIRKGQRWLTLLLVTFVGAVFVFFMGVGGQFGPAGPTGNAVVELDDIRMDVDDFQRMRMRQEEFYREQLGDQFEARTTREFLDAQSLRALVESAVLAQSARELGLRVSREEVQDLVRESPAFRDEAGRFSKDAFVDYTTYEFGNQRRFLETMQVDLLRQKMVSLLYEQAVVSEAEARDAALYGLEQIRIAYVALDTSLPTGDVDVDDETVTAYVEANRAELEALYQERIREYTEDERVRARHILVRAARDADPEQVATAREKIEAARARVASGEAFDAVAAEVSEDPGSKERGGDLGLFSRGTHNTAIEDAAFSLEPGDVSDVVRSDAGFHVVAVESREPAMTIAFDAAAAELAEGEILRKRAEQQAEQTAIQLADAVRAGQSLEAAARDLELTLERTPLVARRPDGFVPGLGGVPEVMATAFSLDLAAPSSPKVHRVADRLVLVQLLEREMPSQQELEAATANVRESLLIGKRNRYVQDWIERRRDALEANGALRVNSALVMASG